MIYLKKVFKSIPIYKDAFSMTEATLKTDQRGWPSNLHSYSSKFFDLPYDIYHQIVKTQDPDRWSEKMGVSNCSAGLNAAALAELLWDDRPASQR